MRPTRLVVYIYVGLLLAGCGLLTQAPDEYVWRLIPNEEANVNWRLQIRNPTGSFKHHRYANPSGTQSLATVTSIDWMEVSPDGDCREAQITGLARELGLAARDIVTIQYDLGQGAGWQDLWSGYIARLPSSDSVEQDRIRLLGLRQRYKEVVLSRVRTGAGDIGAMVRFVATSNNPPGVLIPSTATVPDAGLQLGDRHHNYETFYKFIDDLASTGGVTAQGPIVWGVDASRRLFFRRAGTAQLTLDEATQSLKIDWSAIDSDQVVSAVSVVVATQPTATNTQLEYTDAEYRPRAIAYRYESAQHATYQAEVAIPAPSGTPIFRRMTAPELSDVTGLNFGSSLGAAIDGNDGTSVSSVANAAAQATLSVRIPTSAAFAYGARILYDASGASAGFMDISYRRSYGGLLAGGYVVTTAPLRVGVGQTEVRVVSPPPTDTYQLNGADYMQVDLIFFGADTAGDVVVYSLAPLALDTALLDSIAAAEINLPAARPAEATRFGAILSPRPFASVDPISAQTTVSPVAALRYFIDPRLGLGTIVKLEQDRSADTAAYLGIIDRRQVDVENGVIRWNGGR